MERSKIVITVNQSHTISVPSPSVGNNTRTHSIMVMVPSKLVFLSLVSVVPVTRSPGAVMGRAIMQVGLTPQREERYETGDSCAPVKQPPKLDDK